MEFLEYFPLLVVGGRERNAISVEVGGRERGEEEERVEEEICVGERERAKEERGNISPPHFIFCRPVHVNRPNLGSKNSDADNAV